MWLLNCLESSFRYFLISESEVYVATFMAMSILLDMYASIISVVHQVGSSLAVQANVCWIPRSDENVKQSHCGMLRMSENRSIGRVIFGL